MLWGAVGFIVAFVTVVGSAAWVFSIRPKRLYATALRQISYGNHSEAILLLEKLARAYPGHLAGRWQLGNLYFSRGRYPEAIGVYRGLTHHDLAEAPSIVEVRRQLALAHQKAGESRAALEQYGLLITIAANKLDYHYERGALLLSLKQWPAAREDLERVVRERPRFADGQLAYAAALRGLGEREQAKQALRAALGAAPGNLAVLQALGEVLQEEGEHREALELFQQALKGISEPLPELQLRAAHSMRAQGQFLPAVKLAEAALARSGSDEDRVRAKYELALGLDALGEKGRARDYLREIYRVQPDLPGVREYFAGDWAVLSDADLLHHYRQLHLQEYEQFACALVEQLGFKVSKTTVHSFEAIDVTGERVREISNEKSLFCFRRWAHTVAELPIRELHRQVLEEKAHRGYFIAPTQFTAAAIREAVEGRIELVDGGRLVAHLRQLHAPPRA